jgi:hypothetical protein
MKIIGLSVKLPMLSTFLGFDTLLEVEDHVLALYVVGHTISLRLPAQNDCDILNVVIQSTATVFNLADSAPKRTITDHPQNIDLFVQGRAAIDGYTGTFEGCQVLVELIRSCKGVIICTLPGELR